MFTEVTLQSQAFAEGGYSSNFQLPNDSPIGYMNATVQGSITVTGSPSANPETTLYPAVLNLLGNWNLQPGAPLDGAAGVQLKFFPSGLIYNEVAQLTQNPGTVTGPTGALTASVYTVLFSVIYYFYNPKTPQAQWASQYFRPVRYSNPINLQFQYGTFVKATTVTGKDDLTAYTGTATYTTNLTVLLTCGMVRSQKMSVNDRCFEKRYEYFPNLGKVGADSTCNGILFNDREVQQYIFNYNTGVLNGVETPINNMGLSGPDQIITRFSSTPWHYPAPNNLQSQDQADFLANQSWPAGWYTFNDGGDSFANWGSKTLLNKKGLFYEDANLGQLTVGGTTYTFQDLRTAHCTWALSASLRKAYGSKIRPYAKVA